MAKKEYERQMLEKQKVENMKDTLQFFQSSYRPLIKQADREPEHLQEVFKNAVAKPFVFGNQDPSRYMQQ